METALSLYRIHTKLCLQEDQTKLIHLPPDQYDATTVARLIAYIYQNTYDDVKELPPHQPQSWEDPSWHVYSAGADYILSRMLANAAVHALADFFNMPDLQAFGKARFRTLALEYWKPALPHLPKIIPAVFGTQGNDDPDLQKPVLERCVGIYKHIIIDPACVEAMDTYPAFTRGLLQAVGKHLEDKNTLLTNERKQLVEDFDNLKITADSQESEISVMQSAERNAHEKLNNLLSKRGFSSRGRGGKGQYHGMWNAALKEEIKSIMQMLIPDDEEGEDYPHDWGQECHNRAADWGCGAGW